MKSVPFKIITITGLFLASLSFIACKDTNKDVDTTAMEESVEVEMDITEDESESLVGNMAWTGEYEGTLPCADCEGIETLVVLNDDNTYVITEHYLKGDDSMQSEETGVFEFDESDNTFTLMPSKENDQGRNRLYLLEENQLVALKQDGSKVEGDIGSYYVLTKL